MYGMKQDPRQWHRKFNSFMINQGYARSTSNHCVCVKKFNIDYFIILLIYVEDMLILDETIC